MWPRIGRRSIGPHAPVFAVAAIGLNHGGDLHQAIALVDAAALRRRHGDQAADVSRPIGWWLRHARRPRTSTPPRCASSSPTFELDADAHRAVVTRAREHGLAVLSTPFCEDVLPMLEELEIDAYKIASGDLTYDGLIAAVASTGKPVILSTGMSTLDGGDARGQRRPARGRGRHRRAPLRVGVSRRRPAPRTCAPSRRWRAPSTCRSGLSDHGTGGVVSAVAAVALGACVYERHLMIDDDVMDRAVSSTPAEFPGDRRGAGSGLASRSATVAALPAGRARPTWSIRRGLYAARCALRAGSRIAATDVHSVAAGVRHQTVESAASRRFPSCGEICLKARPLAPGHHLVEAATS